MVCEVVSIANTGEEEASVHKSGFIPSKKNISWFQIKM